MLGDKHCKPFKAAVLALAGALYVSPAMAGTTLPPPSSPPDPVDQEYSSSCLPDGQSYGIATGGSNQGELVVDDGSNYGTPVSSYDFGDGQCSQLSAGNAVVGEEITRLLLTEYFNRMGSVLQNRILGGFFGGRNVAGRDHANTAGRAAGDALVDWNGWSPWISAGRTVADNDLSSTRFDANQDNVLFGADYSYSDRLIVGISGGYENNDVDTRFNLGEMQVKGFTIAPYAAYLLTDNLSIDASVGYSDLDINQFRTEPGGARVDGDTDSSRWFVMSNLNSFHRYGDWVVSGRAGLIYSEEEQDGFTESGGVTAQSVGDRDIEFGQINLGGEVAYSVHAIEPFASLFYHYDFEEADSTALNANQARRSNDDDEFRFAAGFRYFGSNGLSATLEWSKVFDRDNYDSHTLNLLGRLQF